MLGHEHPPCSLHPPILRRRNSPGDISRDSQRAAIRRLATADGHNGDVIEYDDWGVSADIAKSEQRTPSTLGCWPTWRRAPSAPSTPSTSTACTVIPATSFDSRTPPGGTTFGSSQPGGPLAIGDGDDPAAEAFAFIGSVFNRMELQKTKKRARAALLARKERGDDRLGQPPYGYRFVQPGGKGTRIEMVRDPAVSFDPIRAAYMDAGSILGTCRLLEERGVPAPGGGKRWATSFVTRLVAREWPELLPPRSPVGRRTPVSASLAQRSRCPFCSKMLTPNTHRGQYYCSNDPRDRVTHPRYAVREVDVMPWIVIEAARFRVPANAYIIDADNDAERHHLEARREAIIEDYLDPVVRMSKEHRDRLLADVDAKLAAIVDVPSVIDIPPTIDWEHWEPGAVNTVLRTYWRHVVLGPDMRPIRADWKLPEAYWA